jgi:hypothetical protein
VAGGLVPAVGIVSSDNRQCTYSRAGQTEATW